MNQDLDYVITITTTTRGAKWRQKSQIKAQHTCVKMYWYVNQYAMKLYQTPTMRWQGLSGDHSLGSQCCRDDEEGAGFPARGCSCGLRWEQPQTAPRGMASTGAPGWLLPHGLILVGDNERRICVQTRKHFFKCFERLRRRASLKLFFTSSF